MSGTLLRKLVVILAILFAAGGTAYYLAQPAIGWPDEARRKHHPAGFSVIAPKAWTPNFYIRNAARSGTGDILQLVPEASKGMQPSFAVARLQTPPDEAALLEKKYVKGMFQGRNALVFNGERRKLFCHSVVFERDGNWYDLTMNLQLPEDVTTGVWAAYAESFKVERTASMPSTAATTKRVSLAPVFPASKVASMPNQATRSGVADDVRRIVVFNDDLCDLQERPSGVTNAGFVEFDFEARRWRKPLAADHADLSFGEHQLGHRFGQADMIVNMGRTHKRPPTSFPDQAAVSAGKRRHDNVMAQRVIAAAVLSTQ